MPRLPLAFLLVLVAPACAQDGRVPPAADPWWQAGEATITERLAVRPNEGRAKNVILFIGDGMGISTITAMRIFDGQSRGESGEENVLPFEHFAHTALIKTYNSNAQVADSAGTASAMMTGVKTNIGVIDMLAGHTPGTCGNWRAGIAASFAERAELAGRATGVVTTTRLTHATPASVYAHSPDRDWEADADMPPEALAGGCKDIAAQVLDFPGDGLEVAMGGGRSNFLPRELADPEYPARNGRRADGRNLVAEWQAAHRDGAYVTTAAGLGALDLAATPRLLGLFEPSHMHYEIDRAGDAGGEPSLAGMTAAAIDILSQDPDGFFLMVEGGRIDHAHHDGNAARALSDGQAFAQAVATALDKVDTAETLILVTADHSHTLTISGYPPRGNPVLGLVTEIDDHGAATGKAVLAGDGKPFTTLGYANGPGAVTGERAGLDAATATASDFKQQALVPLGSETHGGEDVALFASGPWAHLVGGVLEQNVIYHIMAHAMGL